MSAADVIRLVRAYSAEGWQIGRLKQLTQDSPDPAAAVSAASDEQVTKIAQLSFAGAQAAIAALEAAAR